jgi:ABC-type transporter Mla subunit MlaD
MFGRPVGKQRSRAFLTTIGVLGIVLAAGTFYIGYQAAYTVPGRGYYNIHAQFDNAENLANHYEIRQGGVRIGQLLHPRVKDGKALVDLRIDDKYGPLRSDSQLAIRLRSAVGVRYLEVIPGKRGEVIPDGGTLHTKKSPVALDRVLSMFDAPTRERTRELLNQLGAGTLSRGGDLNEAIKTAPSFLTGLGSVTRAVTEREGAMSRFIGSSDAAADAFDGDEIGSGFDPERRALAPFNDARDDVQRTLDSAPAALASLRATLPRVGGLLDEVGRLARQGRPTLTLAPPALRSTTRLLDDAAKPLGDTRKTLNLAAGAVSPTLDLLGKVSPVLAPLERALGDLIPTLDQLAPRACDMTQFATGWAEYTKWGDSFNSFIRFMIPAVRGEHLAPTAQFQPLKNLVKSESYPAPCENGVGVTGWEQPTVAESQRAEKYSATNLPGEG